MSKYYEFKFILLDDTELMTYGTDRDQAFASLETSRKEEGLETLPWKKVDQTEIYG